MFRKEAEHLYKYLELYKLFKIGDSLLVILTYDYFTVQVLKFCRTPVLQDVIYLRCA